MAIQHAQRVVDWSENLLVEERPPDWMWPFEDELEIWFDEVEEERKNKYGGSHSGDQEPFTLDGPVIENELARGRK